LARTVPPLHQPRNEPGSPDESSLIKASPPAIAGGGWKPAGHLPAGTYYHPIRERAKGKGWNRGKKGAGKAAAAAAAPLTVTENGETRTPFLSVCAAKPETAIVDKV